MPGLLRPQWHRHPRGPAKVSHDLKGGPLLSLPSPHDCSASTPTHHQHRQGGTWTRVFPNGARMQHVMRRSCQQGALACHSQPWICSHLVRSTEMEKCIRLPCQTQRVGMVIGQVMRFLPPANSPTGAGQERECLLGPTKEPGSVSGPRDTRVSQIQHTGVRAPPGVCTG